MLLPTAEPQRKLTLADLPECCQDKRNIVQFWERYDLRITVCKSCNHVYRRLFAEPGSLGAMLSGT